MKRILNNHIKTIFFGLFLLSFNPGFGQDEKPDLILNLIYSLPASHVPELVVQTRIKVERRFENIKGAKVHVYMDEVAEANLLGTIVTSEKGLGKVFIPARLQEVWKQSDKHKFIAEVEKDPRFIETTVEIEIGKARLVLDHSSGEEEKMVTVRLEEKKAEEWVPVPEQEVKVLVKRSMGNILFGEDEAYTTDENGEIEAEFKRSNLLGDSIGNITIIARTEDNELYGNIYAEEIVTWGKPVVFENILDKRTLWSTSEKTPFWLLFLASAIFFSVWAALIYLVWQLFKIIKLGNSKQDDDPDLKTIQDKSVPA